LASCRLYGFFIRHAKGIELKNVEVSYIKEDLRPAFVLSDAKGAASSTSGRNMLRTFRSSR
jgi:hypothetical protein